jgi:hypothetical protein
MVQLPFYCKDGEGLTRSLQPRHYLRSGPQARTLDLSYLTYFNKKDVIVRLVSLVLPVCNPLLNFEATDEGTEKYVEVS